MNESEGLARLSSLQEMLYLSPYLSVLLPHHLDSTSLNQNRVTKAITLP